MRTCSACGYEIAPEDNFCSDCGARVEPAQGQVSPEIAAREVTTAGFNGQPAAAAAAVSFRETATEADRAQHDTAGPHYQATQTANGGQSEPMPAYREYASPPPPPGQYAAGPYAPSGGAAPGQGAASPGAAADAGKAPVPTGYGAPEPVTTCPNCSQAWTGVLSCPFCGQVWGLPKGILLASAGRRFGGYLLEGLLIVCTLVIGWIIWTLIVWTQGQTPAKQLLGMRVVRLDTKTHAGWGRMFLRDVLGKFVVSLVGALLFGIGAVVADCWLLWDRDKQELWDKMAGTVVVNDPDGVLAPSGASA